MALALVDLWNAIGTGLCPWEELSRTRPFTDVVVDSRLAGVGSLFVALPGERSDGHLFVADAVRKGAQAMLVQRPVEGCTTVVDVRQQLPPQPIEQ